MAVSAQALLDEAARLKERYPDADHMAMAEAVLAERERCSDELIELVERRRAEKRNRGNDYILSCAAYILKPVESIRGGHQ